MGRAMKSFSWLIGAALIGTMAFAPRAAAAASALGIWTTAGGDSEIRIAPCGPALCGRIVWLKDPYDKHGKPARDTKNPVKAERSRPILGLEIVTAMRPARDDPGQWRDGRIYDPNSGNTYHAEMRLDGADRLKLRGYIGIPLFGRTTTWTRAGGIKPEPPPRKAAKR